jgi:hypothetical protein
LWNFSLIESNGDKKVISSLSAVAPQIDGLIRVTNPEAATKLKVLILGDSFSIAASPFINAMFSEAYYIHRGSKSLFFDDLHPDLIIYEGVERAF